MNNNTVFKCTNYIRKICNLLLIQPLLSGGPSMLNEVYLLNVQMMQFMRGIAERSLLDQRRDGDILGLEVNPVEKVLAQYSI